MKPSTYTANLNTRKTTAHQRGSSSSTSDVKTITLDTETSAILLTVETTAARITLDGSDPSAASAPSLVIQASQNPMLIPVGSGTVIKWVSTAAAAAVLQVAELR